MFGPLPKAQVLKRATAKGEGIALFVCVPLSIYRPLNFPVLSLSPPTSGFLECTFLSLFIARSSSAGWGEEEEEKNTFAKIRQKKNAHRRDGEDGGQHTHTQAKEARQCRAVVVLLLPSIMHILPPSLSLSFSFWGDLDRFFFAGRPEKEMPLNLPVRRNEMEMDTKYCSLKTCHR